VTHRRRPASIIAALVVLAGVLAVPTTAAAAPVKKACALVKPAEIAAQFPGGEVVKGEKPAGPPGASTCKYDIGTDGASAVAIFLQRGADAKAGYANAKQLSDDAVSLTGLGKKAFVSGGVVWVLKGSTLFYVQGLFFGPNAPADTTPGLTALAQAAYRRV
jgi:hypothetical protein